MRVTPISAATTGRTDLEADVSRGLTPDLAGPSDDAGIRRLLASNPVPGRVTLSFEREPEYFGGCRVLGPFRQVMVGRDGNGVVRAVACRSVRPMFVNGDVRRVGYLSEFRVDSGCDALSAMSRGLRLFRELDRDGRAEGYFTSVVEGNLPMMRLLVARPRPGVPRLHRLSRVLTLAVSVRRTRTVRRDPSLSVDPVTLDDTETLLDFLLVEGRRRQFFGVLGEEDLGGAPGMPDGPSEGLPGLSAGDFVLARRGGEPVGAAAFWDQSAFKQAVVRSYSPAMGRLRPAFDLLSRLRGGQPLPSVGHPVSMAHVAFACVRDDDPAVYQAILAALRARAQERGHAFLMIGHTEDDPLLSIARGYPHIAYPSVLFGFDLADGEPFGGVRKELTTHVDISCL